MAEETQATEEVAKEAEVVVQLKSEFPTPITCLDGTWGSVAIFGDHLISQQMLEMVRDIFSAWDEWILTKGKAPRHHGVHSIVFRDDGHPKNADGELVFAHCLPTVGGIAVNLEKVFDKAFNDAIETPSTSIHCNIFSHVMLAIMHEMDHLTRLYDNTPNEGAIAGDIAKELEKKAEEFSMDFSMFLAQNYDIATGALNEEPFFSVKVLSTLAEYTQGADSMSKEDMAFFKKQQKMALENILFWPEVKKDEQPVILKNYREYLHWVDGSEKDDPKWAKVYEKPAAEPVVATPAETVIQAPPPAVEAPAAEPVVEQNAYTGESTVVVDDDGDMHAAAMSMMGQEPPWEQETDQNASIVVDDTPPAQAQTVITPPPVQEPMPNSSGQAHGLSIAEIQDCSWAVYRRLFNNLFTVCEPVKINPQATQKPDGNGNGCGGFNNILAIDTPVAVSDIPNVDKLFKRYDGKINGRYQKGIAMTGTVSGAQTGPHTLLPKYDLYIITAEGHEEIRTLMPQNPWKTHKKCTACKKGNKPEAQECVQCRTPLAAVPVTYTKPALEAQAGKFIMYVYGPNNSMKMKLLGETDSNGQYREWVEDANWKVIG